MHLRSNNLSNEDDPYSLEKYPKKYQIVIGKQAHNARQLVKAAQAKGAYQNMYRQPLTAAQIKRLHELVEHELTRRNSVARRIDFGGGTTSLVPGAPPNFFVFGTPTRRQRGGRTRAHANAHASAIRQVAEERRELVHSARAARAAQTPRQTPARLAQTPRQTPPRLARTARRRPSP